MKKFLFAVLVMCLSLGLAACGQKLDENSELTTKPIEAENTTAATLPTGYDSVPEALTTEFGTEQQGNSNESGNDFQRQFKADSIKEFFTVLDGIRTGITFNREHETEKMIVEQAVTLICWSRGTTLTSDEIEAEWKNYTSGWEKGEYLSICNVLRLGI